jgi:hypothetical protein
MKRTFLGKILEDRLKSEWPFWLQNQTLNTFEFQDSLQKLGESEKADL